jgi:hypothetical protein
MSTDVLAIISIVSLSVMLVSTLMGYLGLRSKLTQFEKEGDDIRETARKNARAVLDQAQETALKMAQEAILHAQENKNLIKEKLDAVTKQQVDEYQQMVKDSSAQATRELAHALDLKIDVEWERAQKEIHEYEQSRKQEIDLRVQEAVSRATEKLIGTAITPQLHEENVIKALAQAKNEYGF